MPKVDVPKVELPKVDVAGMTTHAKDKVTDTSKSVYGSVTHAVALVREAVGV
jgi:hypothetical protein